MSSPASSASSHLDELFTRWLRNGADAAEFEQLVREHAEAAAELHALHGKYRRVEELLGHAGLEITNADSNGHGHSFAARLKEKYGSGIDPALSLEGEREQSPTAATPASSEILRRLAQRTLQRSRYQLEGEIARGGMGAILKVWDEDLRRSLAMKVILGSEDEQDARAGSTPHIDRRLLARFLEEAQVTGQLDHPGIVPVHELGLDQDGRVFFTMKLVNGRDLRAIFELVFVSKEGWNETRALSLLLRVCEAMSYAHAKGVIHRDLKPANVMVGSFGEVYVMDWGLARVLGRADAHDVRLAPEAARSSMLRTDRSSERDAAADSPLYTMDGDVVGTPAYMPLEQARGEVEKLTARSDVYAIGAMLYHLLARQMPYVEPGARISNRTVLARLLEGPPTPLSKLRVGIPIELVAICEKAMARDASRRYASTLELADDLRAYLEHRVVAAHETGTWAETKKWVQRNKALSSAIAAVLVIALSGAIAFSIKAKQAQASALEARRQSELASNRATELAKAVALAEDNARTAESRRQEAELARSEALQQKQAAERNADETRQVADFQSKLLSNLSIDEFGHTIVVELERDLADNLARLGESNDEIETKKTELNALLISANPTNVAQHVLERAVFEPAIHTIEREYAASPLLAAMLQAPLAQTLLSLGLYEIGESVARAALASRRAELGDDHPDTLTSIDNLGLLLDARGKVAEAEVLCREALEGRRAILGNEHRDTLASINNLASLLQSQGKLTDAEPLYREAIAGLRAELGDDDPDTISSISNFSLLLKEQGKLEEAESLLQQALASRRANRGDHDADTLDSISALASVLTARGRLDEAEPLDRQALAGRRAMLGDDHPDTLASMLNLALLFQAQGKLDEAEPLCREALAGTRAKLGNEHPSTLNSMINLAALLRSQGKLEEAEALCREALISSRARLGDDHPITRASIMNLGAALLLQGKLAEAEPLCRDALASSRASLGDDHPNTLAAINSLAALLMKQGKLSEAEQLFSQALASCRTKLGDQHPYTLAAINNLAYLLKAEDKLAEAEPLCREALAGYRAKLGDDHPDTLVAITNLAGVLSQRGNLAEAEPLLREALASFRAKLGDQDARTQKLLAALISLYDAWHVEKPSEGHDAQAAELRQRLVK